MFDNELLLTLIESNQAFITTFKELLFKHSLTVTDFCEKTKIPESTMYKILSNPQKDFRVSTLRNIIYAVKKLEGTINKGTVFGIITTREALDQVNRRIHLFNNDIIIKEYPATTIEEEIIQGVRAEREGISGIICGPIAATTLEKVVKIPVITIQFEHKLLMEAIERLVRKIEF